MFGNLFNNATFSRSALQNLLAERMSRYDLDNLTPERVGRFTESFAVSLLTERPKGWLQAPDHNVEVEKQAATAVGNLALFFTISSGAAAAEFGKLIDRKQTNAGAAYGLAWCLVEYSKALSVPDKNLNADYHGVFSAGLILWEGVKLFGMLAPWKNIVSEMNQRLSSSVVIDDSIEGLKMIMPEARKAAMDQALQNLQQVKQLSLLLPEFLLRANVSHVVTNPESSVTPNGPVGKNPCSFCNGTGARTCSACGGRGSIIKMNEIIPCVCNRGQARCDYCLGTGKARA